MSTPFGQFGLARDPFWEPYLVTWGKYAQNMRQYAQICAAHIPPWCVCVRVCVCVSNAAIKQNKFHYLKFRQQHPTWGRGALRGPQKEQSLLFFLAKLSEHFKRLKAAFSQTTSNFGGGNGKCTKKEHFGRKTQKCAKLRSMIPPTTVNNYKAKTLYRNKGNI